MDTITHLLLLSGNIVAKEFSLTTPSTYDPDGGRSNLSRHIAVHQQRLWDPKALVFDTCEDKGATDWPLLFGSRRYLYSRTINIPEQSPHVL